MTPYSVIWAFFFLLKKIKIILNITLLQHSEFLYYETKQLKIVKAEF